ncbi:MAG: hypothetical protein PHE67_04305 [Campylobacterales bacterium]|nr:hypothetical protein [Campylobacterales bacterium]
MHRRIRLFLFLFGSLLYANTGDGYLDYGTRGDVYEIRDKNFLELVQERALKLDFKKTKDEAIQNIKKALDADNKLSLCSRNQSRSHTPIVFLKDDIVLPSGEVSAKSGEYNILSSLKEPITEYLFFIDTDEQKQIDFLEQFAQLDKTSLVLVVKGDVSKIQNLGLNAYLAKKELTDIFNVTCTPSLVLQNNFSLQINEYALKEDSNETE